MVYFLSIIGEKIGFKVDIASDEYGKSFDGKRLDSLLNLTQVNLKGYNYNQKKRIKGIDVIWHDYNMVHRIFCLIKRRFIELEFLPCIGRSGIKNIILY